MKREMSKIVAIGVAISVLFFASSKAVNAATGVYLGSGTIDYYGLDYTIKGYVYYNSNTSTTLNVSSLCMWVENNCDYAINEAQYSVHDQKFKKNTDVYFQVSAIKKGKTKRIEGDWSSVCSSNGYNTKYTKNDYVRTNTVCGNSNALWGGWECFWYSSNRVKNFHY